MKKVFTFIIGCSILTIIACSDDNAYKVTIPDFDYPETISFEPTLSSYNIFQGTAANLIPSNNYHLLELSSILFTDYAHKQRLVKIPAGTQMMKSSDGAIDFPDGTILVKTFFYYDDERDTSLGKRIIESRLLIKAAGTWNIATYLWNKNQTDATLELTGLDTPVNWIDPNGNSRNILYHVPDENECIACHQSNSTMIPLGTKLRNLNRLVDRNGTPLNQINHLQALGILSSFQANQVPNIEDYKDWNNTLTDRARAYLELNCAHCHNPSAWDKSANKDLDFRYETPLNQTGILDKKSRLKEQVTNGEMPFIGTSVLDEDGVNLLVNFIENL